MAEGGYTGEPMDENVERGTLGAENSVVRRRIFRLVISVLQQRRERKDGQHGIYQISASLQ